MEFNVAACCSCRTYLEEELVKAKSKVALRTVCVCVCVCVCVLIHILSLCVRILYLACLCLHVACLICNQTLIAGLLSRMICNPLQIYHCLLQLPGYV